MSSADGDGVTPEGTAPADATADEDATGAQVEATVEGAEAEGHAESTAEGAGDAEGDAVVEPEGEPVAETAEGAEAAEPEPEAEAPAEPTTPVDPTSPESEDELRLGILATFKEALGDAVVGAHIRDGDDLWIRVTTEAWRDAAQVAKSTLGCTAFTYLSAIDWLPSPYGRSEVSPFDPVPEPDTALEQGYAGGETRFQVILRVQHPGRGFGVHIKADVPDPDAGVATLIPVYPGANWHEREAWEMYGISFVGHPHLIHLYLPSGFEGNPGRKDFPLLARTLKPWPGIVDVEPMPDEGDDEPAEGEASDAAQEVTT